MKKIKFAPAMLLLFTVFNFISCGDVEPVDPAALPSNPSNPENPENPNTPAVGVFKVNFDSQTYVATTTQAIVNDDYIAITAIRGASAELFQITIPNGTVGTYTWNDFPAGTGFALAYNVSGGNGFVSASDAAGEFADFPNYVDNAIVTISSIDPASHTIAGTFQFTGVRFAGQTGETVETKAFTNGSFNLSYTGDVVAPTGNTFTAKLDGATFTPTNISGFLASGKISVIGRRGNVENISLSLPEDIAVGTYDLDSFSDYVGLYIMNDTGEGTFGADTGSVTITSHNTATNRIKGTFHFSATSFFDPNVHEITEGTFDVGY